MPKNTIRTSHLRTYGTTGIGMPGVAEEPGCPRLYRLKYVEFRVKEPRSFPLEYGTWLHDTLFIAEEEGLPLLPDALDKALERLEVPLGPDEYKEAVGDLTKYLDRSEDNLATVAVEQELVAPLMTIDGEEFWYGGRIDKLSIDTDDPRTLYVTDYKTNRAPPSQRDLDSDNQFTHYMALARYHAPKYLPDVDPSEIRIVGIMDAIKWYQLQTYREQWQIDNYLDWLRAMTRRIVRDQAGEPVLNNGCSWCPVKYDCPEFRKLPGKGDTLRDRMSTATDLQQRVFLMQQAQMTIRGLKSVVDETREELKEIAIRDGAQTINGVVYAPAEDWTTEWDVLKLSEVLDNDFWGVISIGAGKVEELVKRKPELKMGVDASKTRYPKPQPKLTAKKAEEADSSS